jgi:hypothetical protein
MCVAVQYLRAVLGDFTYPKVGGSDCVLGVGGTQCASCVARGVHFPDFDVRETDLSCL